MRARVFAAVFIAAAVTGLASQARRSRILGTVVDRQGNPVAGALVRAENPDNMPPVLEKTTDEEGKFVFSGLLGGAWKIAITADAFVPHEQMAQVGFDERMRTEIVLDRASGAALLATSSEAQEEIDRARAHFEAGDYDAAIALYRELLEKAPEVHQIHFNLAVAYERKDDYASAAEHYERFLEKEPEHFDATLALANALSRTGDREKAIALYRKCTELQPQNAVAFFNLGLALFQSEALDDAAAAFEKSIALDPKLSDGLFMLGNVRLRQGDTAGARASYEKLLQIAPDSPNAEAARKALQDLPPSLD